MQLSVTSADALVARTVRLVGLVSAVLLALTAWAGPLLFSSNFGPATLMTWLVSAEAVVAALIGLFGPMFPDAWAPWWLAVLLGLGPASVALVLAAGQAEPWDVAYLPLEVMAVGALQLRRGWFTVSMLVTWAWAVVGFAAAPQDHLSSNASVGWLVVLVVATGLSLLTLATRRNVSEALTAQWAHSAARASTDHMTEVLNRQGLYDAAGPLAAAALDHVGSGSVTVSFCDVEGLKPVNDTYGHDAGDALIRTVAEGLAASVRAQDLVARWGGDEFVVVSINSTLPPQVLRARLLTYLEAHRPVDDPQWVPGVTVGQAVAHGGEGKTLQWLIDAADRDMYAQRVARRGAPELKGRR